MNRFVMAKCWLITLSILASTDLSAASIETAIRALEAGNHQEALQQLNALAKLDDVEAQFQLGKLFAQGHVVQEDLELANYWLKRAAENGHPEAQMNMGVMAQRGINGPKDDASAARWYKLAATQGFADAQSNLATMFANGEGVSRNEETASHWYRAAATQGLSIAQHNLSVRLAYGIGLPKNEVLSYHWGELAADQLYPSALLNLAVRYIWGRGVSEDLEVAYALTSVARTKDPNNTDRQRDVRAIANDLPPEGVERGRRLAAQILEDGSALKTIARFIRQKTPPELDLSSPEATLAGYIESLRRGVNLGVKQRFLGGRGFIVREPRPITSYEVIEKRMFGSEEVAAWGAVPAAKLGDVELQVSVVEPDGAYMVSYWLRNEQGRWLIFSLAAWGAP